MTPEARQFVQKLREAGNPLATCVAGLFQQGYSLHSVRDFLRAAVELK